MQSRASINKGGTMIQGIASHVRRGVPGPAMVRLGFEQKIPIPPPPLHGQRFL